jgi:hypothetical protein
MNFFSNFIIQIVLLENINFGQVVLEEIKKSFMLTNINLNALSCEMTFLFEIITPFGTPVVPLVKLNVYKSSPLEGFKIIRQIIGFN